MRDRIFVDTNILVYAYDRSEPSKQRKAIDVLDRLALYGKGAISAQVLSEFFVAVTRRISAPLSVDDGAQRVRSYIRAWTVLDVTSFIVLEAARGVKDHHMSFWDAQIWATARLNQIPVVFSEDFNPGSVIDGVLFANPFEEAFDLEGWVR
ncbi:MAG: PIN domain-containing protein [Bacillota bacterium]